jgi:putative photosynthetic complex assembly protein
MRETLNDSHIPPIAIAFTGLVVCCALGFVGWQRLAGVAPVQVATAAIVQERAIRFEDRPDGSIAIFDAGVTKPFEIVASQTNGFLRGTLRGMARARKLNHEGNETPFALTRWADGRLSLSDPQTGRFVALEPFGPTNIAVFKRLLTLDRAVP